MELSVLTAVVVVANVLGAATALPQARKLLQSGSVKGVSLVWASISASVNAWWCIYGLALGDLGIVPVSTVSVMVYLLIAVVLVRSSPAPAGGLASAATGAAVAASIVPAVALVTGGWFAAGIALGALYGVQLSPAVVAVYRSVDVSGVSVATWVLAFVEAGLWGVYGSSGDVGIVTLAATGLVMSSLVLVRLFVRRPRRSVERTPAGIPGFAPA